MALVPDWLDNLAAISCRIIVVVAFVVVLWLIGSLLWVVTASIAAAVVISAVLAPSVLRLRHGGRTRNVAAGIVWATAVLVGIGLLLLLALALLPHMVDLAGRLQNGISALRSGVADVELPAWASWAASDLVGASGRIGGGLVSSIVSSTVSGVTIVILATFLVFFFLRDGDRAWLWSFQGLGEEKRELITTAGDDALARVGGYLCGTTVLAEWWASSRRSQSRPWSSPWHGRPSRSSSPIRHRNCPDWDRHGSIGQRSGAGGHCWRSRWDPWSS